MNNFNLLEQLINYNYRDKPLEQRMNENVSSKQQINKLVNNPQPLHNRIIPST